MQKKLISLIGLLLLSSLPKVSNAQTIIQPSTYVGAGGGTGPLHCLGDGTAALPCYTGSTVNSGVYFSTTSTLISANGVLGLTLATTGLTLPDTSLFGFTSDTNIVRGGVDTLELRRSTNPNVLWIDNTWTSTTSYERGYLGWSGNIFYLGTSKGSGGGSTRAINMLIGDSAVWQWNTSGNLVDLGSHTITQGTANNYITTSTDGIISQNTTAATGGVPVQISPRLRFRGTAWDTAASETVDFFIENLPATAATPTGTLKFGYSLNGAAATYPMTLRSNGDLTTLGAVQSGNDASGTPYLSGSVFVAWKNATLLRGDTNGRLQISNNAITSGVIIDTNSDALMAIITRGGSDAATVTVHTLNLTTAGASMNIAATLQASLGTPSNGTIIYCSDCTIANPCAGGGTGAFAKRLNGVWVCN